MSYRLAACLLAVALAACSGVGSVDTDGPGTGADAGAGMTPDATTAYDKLDKTRAQELYPSTTDLMRYVIAPGCAAERNECHNSEDFPDLSTEGNLWNLINVPCNQGIGDRETVEDFCEAIGDELRVTGGANDGFVARIGSISLVTNADGEFDYFAVEIDRGLTQTQADGTFEFLRGGVVKKALGGGNSLAGTAGATTLQIRNPDHLLDPGRIKQGDENKNGVFGAGTGMLVRPGDYRASYLVRRLLGAETDRVRMPLQGNADNPTEQNRGLSRDQMYALTSWIVCMQPGDSVYSPIRYDCPENAGNEGIW